MTILTVWLYGVAQVAADQEAARETIPPAEGGATWISIVVAVILVLAVIALSFATSKRTHQD
ncbi:MAG: hypothetical protein JJU36_18060 [Phycisphaeraceae bacterium]|nr:hypothetical protein [Phycisphaeraceae bacterium]